MDIKHYFDAVDFSSYAEENKEGYKYSLGAAIESYTSKLTSSNINKTDVVIIGVSYEKEQENNKRSISAAIRKELYKLAEIYGKLHVADLGDLKATNSKKGIQLALRDITEYFLESDIVLVVIGGEQDLTFGICEAYKSNPYFSLAVADAFLDVKKGVETANSGNFLSKIFKAIPDLFQFSLIAYQSHHVAPELFKKTKGLQRHIRLGQIREDITITEPVLRSSNVLSFDTGSIKQTEAPGSGNTLPNGLRSEEACQISRYAGMSGNLKTFGLFNTSLEKENSETTAMLFAQIIWYFLDGCLFRKEKKPACCEDNLIYKVEISGIDEPIIFIKHKQTEQWWLKIKALNGEYIYQGCSEKDYLLASNDDIPEIWLKYLQKIDDLSK